MVDINPINEDIREFQENERPPSEQLVELHLYLVPKDKWLEKRKLAKIQAVDHTISVGFVRVLPQTLLSELRKEMDRQLGIESVPENYVFLRSVGRNFTQVRPKQEMEMKVKNYLPPFAPEPELYLKEGTYTGPNTWSQGEDSGLEESLDSNSQRSHDRATPESLTDDQLVLPKLTDFLDLPDFDEDDPIMPPSTGGMTVSMSADDLGRGVVGPRKKCRGGAEETPLVQAGSRFKSSEDVRFKRIRERSLEKSVGRQAEAARGGSWNRRQKRGESKERGGTQLPTWAETRTTRLRRSRALGETTNAAQKQKLPKRPTNHSTTRTTDKLPPAVPRPPPSYADAEDEGAEEEDEEVEEEDTGAILMERIRANSRCLKAQISASSQNRRTVTDTGTAGRREGPLLAGRRQEDGRAPKNGKVPNGVYTMHARRNLRGGGTGAGATGKNDAPEIESTVIRLVDEHGREVGTTEAAADEGAGGGGTKADEPEVVHQHTLAVDGEDSTRQFENHDGLENISENGLESSGSNSPKNISEADSEDINCPKTAASEIESSEDSNNPSNDLEEGRLVNQNGKLTIEVEVKELGSSEDSSSTPDPTSATIEPNLTAVVDDDSTDYASYRVYSEQNLLTPNVADPPLPQDTATAYSRRSSRTDAVSKNDTVRLSRAKQARGVYLRRMEHRNGQSNIARTQSNEQGLDDRVGGGSPLRRYGNARSVSQSRKSGKARLEKWSTTAASTGDLREAAWDYSNDKERLLTILSEVRDETRIRQRQREELLRKIKQLQSRAHQRREQGETPHSCTLRNLPNFAGRAESAAVREMWRKRYLEAKKISPRLEEECSKLRQELEKLHRELLAKVQAGVWALLTISGKTERPSNKLSYKIMIARLLQEIEDLTRRVEGTRLKLHTEVKLRSMAEKDVRNLREELLKKKIQVTLTRNQEQAALGNGLRQQYFISAM